MQVFAMERWFNSRRIREAVALLILASGLAAVAAVAVSSDGEASSAGSLAIVTSDVTIRPAAFDFQFLEQNLFLPSSPSSALHWKIIEENSWGEDFVFDTPATDTRYPSVDDVPQPHIGVVMY